jgi:hypothetical protein
LIEVINGKTDGFVGSIYIGRRNARYGLKENVLANPFVIGKDGTREEVIAKYRQWLWQNIKTGGLVLNEIERICTICTESNIKLSCWCKPLSCHGDVVKKCVEWKMMILNPANRRN